MDKSELLKKCYGSLAFGLKWIATDFTNEQTRMKHRGEDYIGNSCVLSVLPSIFALGYEQLNTTLLMCKRNNPNNPVDAFLREFSLQDKLEDSIGIILPLLSRPLSDPREYINHKYQNVISQCLHCSNKYTCLYGFTEFLPCLDPNNKGKGSSYNYRLLTENKEEIQSIIDGQLKQTKDGTGWPYSIKEETVDPHVTAKMLEFFYKWKDRLGEFRFKNDYSLGSAIFRKSVQTIKNLQVKEKRDEKYNLEDVVNVEGGWSEVQWGLSDVWRIKGASQISRILYMIEGKSNEVEKAKEFIDRIAGDKPFCLDVTVFGDGYTASLTDIIGTIGAVEFYLDIGKEFNVGPLDRTLILKRISWLIDQQRLDGAWPVISKSMWDSEIKNKSSKILRSDIQTEEKMNGNNLSIRHTVLMINLLLNFLEKTMKS